MSFSRPSPVPNVPTPPQGDEVAAYATYLEAQQAVDYLSDQKFPVQDVTIVGTDLKMVERVTGRLTYGRVAIAGAGSGAWFGLFVGLLLSMFGGGGVANGIVFISIALGAGFGLLFSVLSYALARGRRDFTSQSQIVAGTYAILCRSGSALEARQLLMQSPGGLGRARSAAAGPTTTVARPPVAPHHAGQWGAPAPQQQPTAPPAPRTPDPRWTNPDGTPRYGAMLPTPDQPAGQGQPQPPVPPTQPAPQQPEAQQPPVALPAPAQPITPEPPAQPTPPAPPSDPYAPPPSKPDDQS